MVIATGGAVGLAERIIDDTHVLFALFRYGGRDPKTLAGRMTGGACAMVGIFLVSLPIPIIVNCLTGYYKNKMIRKIFWMQRTKKLKAKRKNARKFSFV